MVEIHNNYVVFLVKISKTFFWLNYLLVQFFFGRMRIDSIRNGAKPNQHMKNIKGKKLRSEKHGREIQPLQTLKMSNPTKRSAFYVITSVETEATMEELKRVKDNVNATFDEYRARMKEFQERKQAAHNILHGAAVEASFSTTHNAVLWLWAVSVLDRCIACLFGLAFVPCTMKIKHFGQKKP